MSSSGGWGWGGGGGWGGGVVVRIGFIFILSRTDDDISREVIVCISSEFKFSKSLAIKVMAPQKLAIAVAVLQALLNLSSIGPTVMYIVN